MFKILFGGIVVLVVVVATMVYKPRQVILATAEVHSLAADNSLVDNLITVKDVTPAE